MLNIIEVEEADVIVDTSKRKACIYSVGYALFGGASNFLRFYERFNAYVDDDVELGALTSEHAQKLELATSRSFLRSIEANGLAGSVRWITADELDKYTTRPRTRKKTKENIAKIVDAISKAVKAPVAPSSFEQRLALSIQVLKRQIAPLLVRRRLIPDVSMIEVVSGCDVDGYPTVEKMLDMWGHIDAVARVGRSGLVGLSVKYTERYRQKLCVGLGLFGASCDGDAYLQDAGRRLLPQYLVSAFGEKEVVSSVLVVERWIVADVLARVLRDLRLSGRELSDIEVETGLVLSSVYLYRVSPRKVLVSIPWAVLQSYGAESSRAWSRSRAAS